MVAYAGGPQDGAAHLRTAIGELEGLGRPEDLLHAHLYLAESLRLLGDFEGALGVTTDGERHARRLGMHASFGRFLALNAATDEFLLGRWDAAEARLAELGDLDLRALERDHARPDRGPARASRAGGWRRRNAS